MAEKVNVNKLPQRKIGNDTVPAIGFGLMSMSGHYAKITDPVEAEKQHLEVLTHAANAGETFWDTSDFYGPYTNEELIGKWFKQTGRRKEIFLATKFGFIFDAEKKQLTVKGDKEYVRKCIEGSLKRLQTDYVDLYYQHRPDKNIPIEETVEAMAELVKEGKVKYLGLSECSEKTLRRAQAVHPIAAVQLEYSLFYTDIEKEEIGLKKACDELGIAIVAYSPLGRGMLTGQYKSRTDFQPNDTRLWLPRFSEENFHKNLELIDKLTQFAEKKGCTTGQLALAWLLKQGDNVIPIPGTRQVKYLEDNLGGLNVELSEEDVKQIRKEVDQADFKVARLPERFLHLCYIDTIEK